MARIWPPTLNTPATTRIWPPVSSTSGSARGAQRLTLASHTLVTGGAQVQSSSDQPNGIQVQLQIPAAGAQLPHTGASCWTRGVILGQQGETIFPWYPALDHFRGLLLERTFPTVANPSLLRLGIFVCNFADPSSASCTEGYGAIMDYSASDVRTVGVMRVSGAGTWASSLGTGNVSTAGVELSCGGGGQAVVRNPTAIATDAFGDNMAPQANNFVCFPAADGVQNTTQQRTLGVAVTWYTGFMVGWSAALGTTGTSVTFDPMYWIMTRPGRG